MKDKLYMAKGTFSSKDFESGRVCYNFAYKLVKTLEAQGATVTGMLRIGPNDFSYNISYESKEMDLESAVIKALKSLNKESRRLELPSHTDIYFHYDEISFKEKTLKRHNTTFNFDSTMWKILVSYDRFLETEDDMIPSLNRFNARQGVHLLLEFIEGSEYKREKLMKLLNVKTRKEFEKVLDLNEFYLLWQW